MILTEKFKILPVLPPAADRYNTNPKSDILYMGDYGHLTFILSQGAGLTGTANLTVEECSDNAGTGANAIPFKYRVMSAVDALGSLSDALAAGYTAPAGADKMVAIEVDAAQLSEGKPWVRLAINEVVNSPVDAGVIAILSNGRYEGADLPSVI